MLSCFLSKRDRLAHRRSAEIDNLLKKSRKEVKEAKILLLGSGESGKSTILKQMKIIHQNGYSKEELLGFKPTIFSNISESIIAIIKGVDGLNLEYTLPENEAAAKRLLESEKELNDWISPQNITDIESLWKDRVCGKIIDAKNPNYYVIDSAPYFFENIRRIGEPEYIPTNQDVLRSRKETERMVETWFYMGSSKIHMVDVGGQRSQRMKWIRFFDNVNIIIFCVSLSEYDQTLLEDPTQNRMTESLKLFESVVNSRWFFRTSIILFLNKLDLFEEKLPRIPLGKFFPEYNGVALGLFW